ncbi:hypothetical protein [Catellatospora sp. NPDC049609]|uniref:hypothetical protein n=1 Tax=Catellatospora sp. NPDC049609 TaxID=3155505 RepID=UPI00342FC696
MTTFVRRARRWLAWIHYTDRVRYWRALARRNRDAAITTGDLHAMLTADAEGLREQLAAALADCARLETERDSAVSGLGDAHALITAQEQVIKGLGDQLAKSAVLAEMTPARRASVQAAQEQLLATLDPARAGGPM